MLNHSNEKLTLLTSVPDKKLDIIDNLMPTNMNSSLIGFEGEEKCNYNLSLLKSNEYESSSYITNSTFCDDTEDEKSAMGDPRYLQNDIPNIELF